MRMRASVVGRCAAGAVLVASIGSGTANAGTYPPEGTPAPAGTTTTVEVVSAGGAGALADTGQDSDVTVVAASAVLAVGLVLRVIARGRRHPALGVAATRTDANCAT